MHNVFIYLCIFHILKVKRPLKYFKVEAYSQNYLAISLKEILDYFTCI
jgi:hypothetical protein